MKLPPLPELENFKLFISFWKIVQILLEIFVKCRAIKSLFFHVCSSALPPLDVIQDRLTSCHVKMLSRMDTQCNVNINIKKAERGAGMRGKWDYSINFRKGRLRSEMHFIKIAPFSPIYLEQVPQQ